MTGFVLKLVFLVALALPMGVLVSTVAAAGLASALVGLWSARAAAWGSALVVLLATHLVTALLVGVRRTALAMKRCMQSRQRRLVAQVRKSTQAS